ncbi:hypothetical protein H2248_008929 [Termitomyces sp. 'cryptogamus']|nr:hypothetical protein H2248_008929 [Termitomyces sp. 'cryptogamus']
MLSSPEKEEPRPQKMREHAESRRDTYRMNNKWEIEDRREGRLEASPTERKRDDRKCGDEAGGLYTSAKPWILSRPEEPRPLKTRARRVHPGR